MDVWIRKCASFEEEARADREFWKHCTAQQRVEAVEDLRLQSAEDEDGDRQGLEELFESFRSRTVRTLHTITWSSDRRSVHDPGPPLRSE
jgi:hypothetical protein